MNQQPDWTLLGRFLGGECSPEEAEAVARWVAADAEHARLLELLRTVWREAGMPRPDLDAGWAEMRRRMAAMPPASAGGTATGGATMSAPAVSVRPLRVMPSMMEPRRLWWRRPALAAAAVVALASAGTLTWWQGRMGAESPVAGAAREYVTRPGQQAKVMLVDGTRVWLSVDSRLSVPSTYGTAARDVTLEGEAYFEVQHDPARPFRVHARGAVSEDLGTEFNVRAYPDESGVVVVVASGRVVMRRNGAPDSADVAVELGRGQLGRLDRGGRVTVVDDVELGGVLGWRDGRLEFEERPLDEVLREIGRWYDLDITLEDPVLARVPVTLSLSRHTVDEALAIVAGVVDVRYVREGREVRLMSGAARH